MFLRAVSPAAFWMDLGPDVGPQCYHFPAFSHHFWRSEFGRETYVKKLWILDWPQVVK